MATDLQKTVFKKKLEKIQHGERVVMKDLILEAGGSLNTANRAQSITKSKGWGELKAKYADDERALQTLYDLAGADNEDKDNRLKASIETLKLNDRYPAQKSKIMGLMGNLDEIFGEKQENKDDESTTRETVRENPIPPPSETEGDNPVSE
jgi:hypothetical protein